ncbi:MAG: pyrroline-5-carboxylate reductase [Anaerolineae bacterium]|jgi:pyrroline-5-carboxylate reductase
MVEPARELLSTKAVAFIGSGTMAQAMMQVLINKGLISPARLSASGPREERARELNQRYGVVGVTDNREAAEAADVVVLSVKPQVLPTVLRELEGLIYPDGLVLSIVAGMRVETIASGLKHPAVVRAMPNTPAQIGEGMTVWTGSPGVDETQREQARAILQAMGQEIYVEDEGMLDMATAVSGTGPTYVFLMMEALTDAAVHLGFSRRVAEQLVVQTVLGSAMFAGQTDRHLAEMRNMVTSPGGTSAEAVYQLEKGGLRTVLSKAVWAAYQKSRLLGKALQAPRDPNGFDVADRAA